MGEKNETSSQNEITNNKKSKQKKILIEQQKISGEYRNIFKILKMIHYWKERERERERKEDYNFSLQIIEE